MITGCVSDMFLARIFLAKRCTRGDEPPRVASMVTCPCSNSRNLRPTKFPLVPPNSTPSGNEAAAACVMESGGNTTRFVLSSKTKMTDPSTGHLSLPRREQDPRTPRLRARVRLSRTTGGRRAEPSTIRERSGSHARAHQRSDRPFRHRYQSVDRRSCQQDDTRIEIACLHTSCRLQS